MPSPNSEPIKIVVIEAAKFEEYRDRLSALMTAMDLPIDPKLVFENVDAFVAAPQNDTASNRVVLLITSDKALASKVKELVGETRLMVFIPLKGFAAAARVMPISNAVGVNGQATVFTAGELSSEDDVNANSKLVKKLTNSLGIPLAEESETSAGKAIELFQDLTLSLRRPK